MYNINTSVTDYMSIMVTHECNRVCKFCIDQYRGEDTYISLESVNNALEFAREKSIKDILLVGGEPTLHQDIYHIAKTVHDAGFNTILTTNFDNLDIVYALDDVVDSFNFSYYGQKELPDPLQFQHADITLSTLIHRTGFVNTREKLDSFIDRYQDAYTLKFATLTDVNSFTKKNRIVDYLDELPNCEYTILFNELVGQIYRGHVIKRYDLIVNHNAAQSHKCHVNGHINQSWNRDEQLALSDI